MSAEQIVDGIIKLIQDNAVARTALTQDILNGQNVLHLENAMLFEDGREIAVVSNQVTTPEFHTVLVHHDNYTVQLLHPVEHDFRMSEGAVVQKAIGNVPLYENQVLFGDRNVIPTNDVSVTVDPVDLTNDWIYLQGGLDEEYGCSIMVYLRADSHDDALRAVMKYADYIYRLLNQRVHMDVVNDEQIVTADISVGDTVIDVTTVEGWPVDALHRYEIQDNNHVEIDFRIEQVYTSPPRIRIERPVLYDYSTTQRLRFRRRVRYIYDSRCNRVEWGFVSKESGLYKAAKLTWFGKETEEYVFPQPTKEK